MKAYLPPFRDIQRRSEDVVKPKGGLDWDDLPGDLPGVLPSNPILRHDALLLPGCGPGE